MTFSQLASLGKWIAYLLKIYCLAWDWLHDTQ